MKAITREQGDLFLDFYTFPFLDDITLYFLHYSVSLSQPLSKKRLQKMLKEYFCVANKGFVRSLCCAFTREIRRRKYAKVAILVTDSLTGRNRLL